MPIRDQSRSRLPNNYQPHVRHVWVWLTTAPEGASMPRGRDTCTEGFFVGPQDNFGVVEQAKPPYYLTQMSHEGCFKIAESTQ